MERRSSFKSHKTVLQLVFLCALLVTAVSISLMMGATRVQKPPPDGVAVTPRDHHADQQRSPPLACMETLGKYPSSQGGANDIQLLEACNTTKPSDAPFVLLKHVLSLPGDIDEFGGESDFQSLVSIVRKLMELGALGRLEDPHTAVNLGARDGIGTMGNTDPTWPLFKDLGFEGIAVEGSAQFQSQLEHNFRGLKAKPIIGMITPENVVGMIRNAGLSKVDVFKINIDSWDCEVLPVILKEASLGIKVVLVEYNVKFPPPIKMNLATCPQSRFRSCARYHIYECSLQYMNDNVMAPAGYSLAQVDWQNAFYVHESITSLLKVPKQGINPDQAYKYGYSQRKNRAKNMPWTGTLSRQLCARVVLACEKHHAGLFKHANSSFLHRHTN
jgi:hypothetical protein